MLTRFCRRLVVYLHSFVPTPAEHAFRTANRRHWRAHPPAPSHATYALIDVSSNPIIRHCDAAFGALVCRILPHRPLYLVPTFRDRSVRRLLRSYAPDPCFVGTWTLSAVWAWLLAWGHAWRTWRTWTHPRDVLAFHCDGIRFGDVLYNSRLAQGVATIHTLDWPLFRLLHRFYTLRAITRRRLHRLPIQVCVVSHTIDLPSAVLVRYHLHAGGTVLHRLGSHDLHVQQARTLSDLAPYSTTPSPQIWATLQAHRETILPLADAYLTQRHDGQVPGAATDQAFAPTKRRYTTRLETATALHLDVTKPTACVLLHVFTDYPHPFNTPPLMFQDYYDWLQVTLACARHMPHWNWVFKEHPAAALYPVPGVDLPALMAGLPEPSHLHWLPADADFQSASLPHVADVLVTCLGTAGLEYTALGIPCVLGGATAYSGFGLTSEPSTVAAYRHTLLHLETLPPVTAEQQAQARLLLWFQLPCLHSLRFPYCPAFDWQTLRQPPRDATLATLADWMRHHVPDSPPVHALVARFLQDPQQTQLLNTLDYPFLAKGTPLACFFFCIFLLTT